MTKKSHLRALNFKLAREYRGYTQDSLAKNIKGLSQSNISKFEKGFEGIINDDKIEETMNFLKFPVSFLDAKINHWVHTSWG